MKKSRQALNQDDQQQAEKFTKQAVCSLEQALTIAKAHFPADCPHRARIQGKLEEITRNAQDAKK